MRITGTSGLVSARKAATALPPVPGMTTSARTRSRAPLFWAQNLEGLVAVGGLDDLETHPLQGVPGPGPGG
jgi:hypothetical protein